MAATAILFQSRQFFEITELVTLQRNILYQLTNDINAYIYLLMKEKIAVDNSLHRINDQTMQSAYFNLQIMVKFITLGYIYILPLNYKMRELKLKVFINFMNDIIMLK